MYIKHLNIHSIALQNPYFFDMKIAEAKIVFCNIQIETFAPGVAWIRDDCGNSHPETEQIVLEGEKAASAFISENNGIQVYDFEIQNEDNRTIVVISGSGNEPYFECEFSFTSASVEWDSYNHPAWYEETKQYQKQIAIDVGGVIQSMPLHIISHNNEKHPEKSVILHYGNRDYIGKGYMLADALINLAKQLPKKLRITSCW